MPEQNKQSTFIDRNDGNEPRNERSYEMWQKFLKYEQGRNQNVRFLSKEGRDRNILDYVKDSVDRMNEFHLKPDWKEDWMQNVFDPITRNKVIAILSIVATARLQPELIMNPRSIFAPDDIARRRRIYSDLLEHANIKNNDDYKLIWEMYSTLSEGTVFGFESWKKDKREVEYVIEYDPDTGEKKTKKMTINAWDDVYGEMIPLNEIYPESIWESDWNNIHRLFWDRRMFEDKFMDTFGGFEGADKVKPHTSSTTEDLPWGVSDDIQEGEIQVLMYIDEKDDKMHLMANGRELYYGCLPWNHKRKPIWCNIGEPIHQDYLYGKSMPDKLMSMQDVNNSSLNGMLDQMFMALNSPIFADGLIDLDDGYLEPSKIYELEPGGKVEKSTLGAVDPSAYNLLSLLKRSMEETSISAQAQGVPTGGRKTKFEVQQLQEGATQLAGLFIQMTENAMSQKYWLRMYNILQYYSMPGLDHEGKKQFKFITMDNRELTNKKTGTRRIQIVGSQADAPAPQELADQITKETGKPFDPATATIEPIVITRDYLMNKEFDLEVKIVPNSSVKESESERINKNIAWNQLTTQNPRIDQEQNLRDLAEAFGKSDKIIKEGITDEQIAEQQAQAEQKGQPGRPGMSGLAAQPQPQADLL